MHALRAIHERVSFNSLSRAKIHENAVFNSLDLRLPRLRLAMTGRVVARNDGKQ